jgi:hypothetical protein
MGMSIQQQALRLGQPPVTRRLGRTLPWIGTAIALITLGSRIRRKGFVRGSADTALTAIPVVGTLKGLAEVVRGRDFFSDKRVTTR